MQIVSPKTLGSAVMFVVAHVFWFKYFLAQPVMSVVEVMVRLARCRTRRHRVCVCVCVVCVAPSEQCARVMMHEGGRAGLLPRLRLDCAPLALRVALDQRQPAAQ